jgi:hypothetical protein
MSFQCIGMIVLIANFDLIHPIHSELVRLDSQTCGATISPRIDDMSVLHYAVEIKRAMTRNSMRITTTKTQSATSSGCDLSAAVGANRFNVTNWAYFVRKQSEMRQRSTRRSKVKVCLRAER